MSKIPSVVYSVRLTREELYELESYLGYHKAQMPEQVLAAYNKIQVYKHKAQINKIQGDRR
jgi:hypothetical protein